MHVESRRDITELLDAISDGKDDAWSRLLPLVYDELRVLARLRLARLKPGGTLRTVDLVHESYIRLVGRSANWENRRHFFGAASRAMRDILVDEARHRGRLKRGGDWQRVTCGDGFAHDDGRSVELLALDEVLDRLEEQDPLQHQIVMLRYFSGLSIDEAAKLLGVSSSTVDRGWKFARAWLHRELRER